MGQTGADAGYISSQVLSLLDILCECLIKQLESLSPLLLSVTKEEHLYHLCLEGEREREREREREEMKDSWNDTLVAIVVSETMAKE